MNVKWVGAGLGVMFLVLAPSAASAAPPNEPSGHASCIGTLSVFNQAHPEFFGTRSDIAHDFIAGAAAEGIAPGEIYAFYARAHGTVEQCP